MANIKPIDLKVGHSSTKAEIKARKKAEESLKGKGIGRKKPTVLSEEGKKIFKHLLTIFPKGFLAEADVYTLEILADSIDQMRIARMDILKRGQVIDGEQNPSIGSYFKYAKLYDSVSAKMAMSPRERAQLALLLVNQQQENEDEVVKIVNSIRS